MATATALSASILLATTAISTAQEAAKTATITVTADGETTAKPDMAVISLGVVTQGKTADAALAANTESLNKAIEALKAAGIEERDMQTSNFSIYPVYDDKSSAKASSANEQDAKEVTYRINNALSVRVRDLAKLGTILDDAVKLGINSSNSLTLTNADTKPYISDARKQAVIEARERAETLAEAAGVKLGRILDITEGNTRFSPIQQYNTMMKADMAAARAPVPVADGELNYRINVTVTFEIAE